MLFGVILENIKYNGCYEYAYCYNWQICLKIYTYITSDGWNNRNLIFLLVSYHRAVTFVYYIPLFILSRVRISLWHFDNYTRILYFHISMQKFIGTYVRWYSPISRNFWPCAMSNSRRYYVTQSLLIVSVLKFIRWTFIFPKILAVNQTSNCVSYCLFSTKWYSTILFNIIRDFIDKYIHPEQLINN